MPDRSTAISRPRGWRSPTARISAAASTCSGRVRRSRARSRSPINRPRRRRRSPSAQPRAPLRSARSDGGLTGLFKRALRKPEPPAPAPVPAPRASSSDIVTTSKVFPRFLSAVAQQAAPVLIDLGPVVGSNITFFGDRLSCKIYVEDLVAEVESHARRDERAKLVQSFETRLR